MKSPWMKFYPTDWRADPRLRMCSLEARGLWIELMGFMHEAEPYGHLLIGGKSPSISEIANMVGAHHNTVRKAIMELSSKGVCSQDTDGVMYSRRMVRDFEKAKKDKANGSKGGNPGLTPTPAPEVKAHMPDARIQNLESKKDGAAAPSLFPVQLVQKSPDARVYERAREVLIPAGVKAKEAGRIAKELIRIRHGNYALAVANIETASTKDKPDQYLYAMIRGASNDTRMGEVEYREL
jgi:hypothetical protein